MCAVSMLEVSVIIPCRVGEIRVLDAIAEKFGHEFVYKNCLMGAVAMLLSFN